MIPPKARNCTKGLTSEQVESLPPFQPHCQSFPAAPSLQELRQAFPPDYESAQSLIESLGSIQYMDLDYKGKPTTWNQQFPQGPYN